MLEKSSKAILTEQEKRELLESDLVKSASEDDVPERFKGWYSRSELVKIAKEEQ